MAGRGPAPKSAKQRAADGSRKRPGHHPQITPLAGEPSEPAGLCAVALAKWRELAELMRAEERLTQSEGHYLEHAARAYCRAVRPGAPTADVALYRQCLKDGGFTPIDRTRVTKPTAEDDATADPFAALQARVAPIRRVK